MKDPVEQNRELLDRVERLGQTSLTGIALTLMSVLISIGLTVGFGLSGSPWWVRVVAGVGTIIVLSIGIKILIGRRGGLIRVAEWLTGVSPPGTG